MHGFFANKIVWITGASSGIGEALAYAFSKTGVKLILSARNETELMRVRDHCALPTADVFILPLDLAQYRDIEIKAKLALDHWGHIDYMVHNAGIAARDHVENTGMDVFRKVMETNFFGTVALTQAVLPSMRKAGAGHFVVICSLSAKFGAPLLSAYAASKHALIGFFESVRTEIIHENIGIHLMVPGFINTPILIHAMDGQGVVKGKNLRVNEEGMSPEKCAERIIRAVRKGKHEAMIGSAAWWSVTLHRFFPNLFTRMISNHPMKKLRQWLPRWVK